MDFEKVSMLFAMQEPYYGILLSSMEHIQTDKIDTLCMARRNNVFKLYYNKAFFDKFDIDTQIELIRHEVLHAAFNHFCLWSEEEKAAATKEMAHLMQIAADLDVNCYVKRGNMQKEAGGVFCEDLGFEKNMGAREYLRLLIQKFSQPQPQQNQAQNPVKPCNGGQGGGQGSPSKKKSKKNNQNQQNQQQDSQSEPDIQNSQEQEDDCGEGQQQANGRSNLPSEEELKSQLPAFDDHSQWPEMEEGEAEQLTQALEDLLVFAADEVEKGCGTIPGEIAGKIKLLREKKKPKPVADWKRYFRRYLGNEFTELIRKSKKRESRRFPDAAGNRHRRKSHILVGIDTSGSVSMPEYQEFFSQLSTLKSSANFHVIECDSRIQHEYEFKNTPNTTLHGGGGTSFSPVVDYFNEHKRIYDALVYFTDGEAPIPRNTPKDTLWVISSKGNQHDRQRYRVNGASVAFIPKKDN